MDNSHISTCFTELVSLLQTRDHNDLLQLDIEKYLFDSKNVYYNNIKGGDTNYGSESSKFIIGKTEELERIFHRDYIEADPNIGNPKWSLFKNFHLTREIVQELGVNKTANIAITYILNLLTMEKLGKNFGAKSVFYEEDFFPIEEDYEGGIDIEDVEHGYKPIREIFCNSQLGNILLNQYKYKLYNKAGMNKSYKFGE